MSHADDIAAAKERVIECAKMRCERMPRFRHTGKWQDTKEWRRPRQKAIEDSVAALLALEAQTCGECGGHALKIFPAPGGFQRGIVHEKCPACSGTGRKEVAK